MYNLYDAARALCKASADDVSPELRRYLSDGRAVAQSLAFKWLGVDAGENGGRDKAGEALAWLGVAKSGLEDVRGKSAGIGMLKVGKGKKAGRERKGKIADEVDSVAAFLSAYKKVNDTVRPAFFARHLDQQLMTIITDHLATLPADPVNRLAPAHRPKRHRGLGRKGVRPAGTGVQPKRE